MPSDGGAEEGTSSFLLFNRRPAFDLTFAGRPFVTLLLLVTKLLALGCLLFCFAKTLSSTITTCCGFTLELLACFLPLDVPICLKRVWEVRCGQWPVVNGWCFLGGVCCEGG